MSKHIDLAAQIKHDREAGPVTGLSEGAYTLVWLDKHSDQLPGQELTESELDAAQERAGIPNHPAGRKLAVELGRVIVPDSEPTNAELLAIYLGLHDLDAITQAGVAEFARQLDADGIKAPEANDE